MPSCLGPPAVGGMLSIRPGQQVGVSSRVHSLLVPDCVTITDGVF